MAAGGSVSDGVLVVTGSVAAPVSAVSVGFGDAETSSTISTEVEVLALGSALSDVANGSGAQPATPSRTATAGTRHREKNNCTSRPYLVG